MINKINISINGKALTEDESLVIQYALDNYDDYLTNNGLGEDQLALSINGKYRNIIEDIHYIMRTKVLDFDTRS